MVVASVAGIALVIAVVWPREKEPVYQGRKLSAWLRDYSISGETWAMHSNARAAIRGIGTNSLPYLVRWLSSGASPSAEQTRSLLKKIPNRRIQFQVWEAEQIPQRAIGGFAALGPLASPALPQLKELMYTSDHPLVRYHAMLALAKFGDEGFSLMRAVLKDNSKSLPKRWEAYRTIMGIGAEGTDISEALPAILKLHVERTELEGKPFQTNEWKYLVYCLGRSRFDKFERCLSNHDADVRYTAVVALDQLGAYQGPSLDVLRDRLSDSDLRVREAATNAIRQVAPKMLAH
jgi:HEAT repeat protein